MIPPPNQRALDFVYESEENTRICTTCYFKNTKELKKRRKEEDKDIVLPPKVMFFVKLKECLLNLILSKKRFNLKL